MKLKTTLLTLILSMNSFAQDNPFNVKEVTADNLFNAPYIYAKPYSNCVANPRSPPYNLSYREMNLDQGEVCYIPLTTCALRGPMKVVDCKDTVPFWRKPI